MNWGDFFAMGGYGLYVWGSYSVTALFMVVEVILLLSRKRTLLQRLGRMNRADSAAHGCSGSCASLRSPHLGVLPGASVTSGRTPEVTEVTRTGEIKHEDRI